MLLKPFYIVKKISVKVGSRGKNYVLEIGIVENEAKEARLKMELKFIGLETQREAELKRVKIAK